MMRARSGLSIALVLACSAPAGLYAAQTPATAQTSSLFAAFISSAPDAHSSSYEIQKGDNLSKIAKKHQVTVDLLKKVNGLADDKLIPGKKLKIPTYKLSVLIDKSDNMLTLRGDQEILKTYVVSTGLNNSTPVGTFKITDKLENPTWYKAGAVRQPGDKDNQLGTRWMGITAKGYGIHGTLEPEKLGQQVTAGCVRMKTEEVEELYSIVPPGTEVVIQD